MQRRRLGRVSTNIQEGQQAPCVVRASQPDVKELAGETATFEVIRAQAAKIPVGHLCRCSKNAIGGRRRAILDWMAFYPNLPHRRGCIFNFWRNSHVL